jgi:hypothetical protein
MLPAAFVTLERAARCQRQDGPRGASRAGELDAIARDLRASRDGWNAGS